MTPAERIKELLDSPLASLGYVVYVNHLPDGKDGPDKALVVVDIQGKLDDRTMRGTVTDHPKVRVTVRGRSHSAAGILDSVWDVLKNVYMHTCSDGQILQCVTKANTMASSGQEPQTRRTRYSQQFRMSLRG